MLSYPNIRVPNMSSFEELVLHLILPVMHIPICIIFI